jgi:hypothetical protein
MLMPLLRVVRMSSRMTMGGAPAFKLLSLFDWSWSKMSTLPLLEGGGSGSTAARDL